MGRLQQCHGLVQKPSVELVAFLAVLALLTRMLQGAGAMGWPAHGPYLQPHGQGLSPPPDPAFTYNGKPGRLREPANQES